MADMNNGNIDFSENQSSINRTGISSSLQNRLAKQQFQSDFYREGTGYLANNKQSLEEMQKQFDDLRKSITSLNKEQQKSIQKQLDALEKWTDKAKDIQENQNISDKEAMKFVEKSNEARLNAALEYQRITKDIANNQQNIAEDEQEYAQILKEELDMISDSTKQVANEVANQNSQIERTRDILKETQSSFSKGLSQTLKSASDQLTSLVNMFNIDSLANSDINKFFSSKLDMQNDIMKTFSMESKQQYIDFKNSLNATLDSMGDLYNANDLTTFMSNLSSMGITDTNMAQQLMKSSIQATKYLGVSQENQETMFKWMKRTNDYDMLDKHNRTIVGLLKSDLGVSKEQLDALTAIAYENNDTMTAIGMTDEAIEAVNNASLIVGSDLMGAGLDEKTAASLQKVYQDFITASIDELGAYGVLGVSNPAELQNMMRTSTDTKQQTELATRLYEQLSSSNALSGTDTYINQAIQKIAPALDVGQMAGLRNLDFDKYYNNISNSLNNVDKALQEATPTDNYIENTTELTSTDKIYNKLTEWFDGIDWTRLTGLAMVAFGLQASASVVDTFSSLAQLKNLGGLKALFGGVSKTGEGISLLSGSGGLLATGGGLLIGAAAIAAITSAISNSTIVTKNDVSKDTLNKVTQENKNKYGENSELFNSSTFNSVTGQSETALAKGNIGTALAGATANYLVGRFNYFSNPEKQNKESWRNFTRIASGIINNRDQETALRYMYAILLNEVGMPSMADDMFGITKDDIKSYIKNVPDAEKALVAAYNYYSKQIGHGIYMPTTIDGNRYGDDEDFSKSLDGYHKNGLDKVPRDGYKALLHKNEMVLNEKDAENYKKYMEEITNTNNNKPGFGGIEDVGHSNMDSYSHTGLDVYFDKVGTKVGSAVPGTVVGSYDIGWNGVPDGKYHGDGLSSYGRVVKIKGDQNKKTYIYAHLSKRLVSPGQHVNAGDLIGLSGSSGNSSGPHLHFEIAGLGSGSRNHAQYFTKSVRNIGDESGANFDLPQSIGSTSSNPIATNSSGETINADGSVSSSNNKSKPVTTGRFIPKSMASSGGKGGKGGAEMITGSIDNNFTKLINYLNDIKSEQSSQREMLNAFSKLNSDSSTI